MSAMPWQCRIYCLLIYREVVVHCPSQTYSSLSYSQRLQSPQSNCLYWYRHSCNHHSKVHHRLLNHTCHVHWPQQLLKLVNTLTSYSNHILRQFLRHSHPLSLHGCHTSLWSQSIPYSCFSTVTLIIEQVLLLWAYYYMLAWKVLHKLPPFGTLIGLLINSTLSIVSITALLLSTTKNGRKRNTEYLLPRVLIAESTIESTIESTRVPTAVKSTWESLTTQKQHYGPEGLSICIPPSYYL